MKNIVLFLSIILLCTLALQAQDGQKYVTESDTHIAWQSDRPITPADYQCVDADTAELMAHYREFRISVFAATGLFYKIDNSKGKYKPGKYYERLYMAPLFQKNKSSIIIVDSLNFLKEQLIFDLEEAKSRFIKNDLYSFLDSVVGKTDNPYTFWFPTFYDKWVDRFEKISDQYVYDVYIKNEEGAYDKWRRIVDEWLEKYKEYATTPEECHRILTNEPVDKNLRLAKYLNPSFYRKDKQNDESDNEIKQTE